MFITIKIMSILNHSYSIPMHPNKRGEVAVVTKWMSPYTPILPSREGREEAQTNKDANAHFLSVLKNDKAGGIRRSGGEM
jgi:hypothetical protein